MNNSFFKACLNCMERRPGCHDTCERYLAEKEKCRRAAAKEKYEHWINAYVIEAQERAVKGK